MDLSSFSIKRPVAVSMATLAVLILGIVSVAGIPVTLLPEISFPKITVRTEYPQAAPAEVENLVTKPVEQAVGIINNVIKISSISKSGMSEVIVELSWGTDLDVATMDMREKLGLIQFPEDVKKPLILRYDPASDPIMKLGVTADMNLSELRYLVEKKIERELERVPGVAAVKVQGGYEDEIAVDIDEKVLTQYGLNITEIIDRLDRENITLAGGTLKDAGAELSVRTTNQFSTIQEIGDLVISGGRAPSGGGMAPSGGGMMGGAMMGGGGPGMPGAPGGTAVAGAQGQIRLKDIATLTRRHKRRSEIARLNDKECVEISVFKEGGGNVVQIAGKLHEMLDSIREGFEIRGTKSEGTYTDKSFVSAVKGYVLKKLGKAEQKKLMNNMNIQVIIDQSVFIQSAIVNVVQTALWGSLMAVMVLYLFLRDVKSTFIIGIAIPLSVVATFTFMFFMGITVNVMSLGGLALGVGILVDNSIVVMENIFRHREEKNKDAKSAALDGTSEVKNAVTGAMLTNIAIFLPIVFVEGVAGQIFGDLGWTVAISLFSSEIVAFTIIPMLAHQLKVGKSTEEERQAAQSMREGEGPLIFRVIIRMIDTIWGIMSAIGDLLIRYPRRAFDASFAQLTEIYPIGLEWTIKRPTRSFLISVLAIATGIFVLVNLQNELLPEVDQREFTIHMEFEEGTPIEETDLKISQAEGEFEKVRKILDIKDIFAAIGFGTSKTEGVQAKAQNIAEINITLNKSSDYSDVHAMDKLREKLKILPGVEIKMVKPTLLSYRAPIEVEISGYNLAELKRISKQVATSIYQIKGVYDVENTADQSNPEINVNLDRDRLASFGLSVGDVTEILKAKVKGEVATYFDEGEKQIEVSVQLREEDRKNKRKLENITIPRPGGIGEPIPLKSVGVVEAGQGPGKIYRTSNSRVAIVTANLTGRALGEVVKDIESVLNQIPLKPGYYFGIAGQNEEMERSLGSLLLAAFLAIALVYIVMASLFESILQPLIMMFCVPFALVGIATLFVLTGTSLNVFSFIGIMMVSGICVNDAIVFVETINLNRDRGMERADAIMEAGRTRLRPILSTSLTTIFGMLPMSVLPLAGSEMWKPIAQTVIGGLITSTPFTLIFIPAIYIVFDKVIPRKRLERTEDGKVEL